MTGPLYRLGGACSRHRLVTVGVWIAVVVALGALARGVGQQTSDDLALPGTDSAQATDVLESRFPAEANGTVPITLHAPRGSKLTQGGAHDAVQAVVAGYRKDPAVRRAVDPLSDAGAAQLTKDARTGYIALTLRDSASELTAGAARRLIAVSDPAKDAGLEVAAGGYLGQKVSKPSTHVSEVVGLVAAVLILLATFGSAVAMGLPILTALFGLVGGLSGLVLLGRVVQVPTTAPALATMIGLGVGIDYGLFVVTRHLDQLRSGMDVRESVARSTATAGGAVVFAGGTVVIALLALALAGIPLVTTLGYLSALVVCVAVLAAVTLLPALLSLLGPRVNRLRLPGLRQRHVGGSHGWQRWVRLVADHPWRSLLAGSLVLVVLAVPLRGLDLGQTDVGALPRDTTARQAYDRMTAGFGAGANGPLLVATTLTEPARNDQAKLEELEAQQREAQAKQQDQAAQKTADLTQQLVAGGTPPAQAQAQAEQRVTRDAKRRQDEDSAKAAQTKEQKRFLATTASDPRLRSLRGDLRHTAGIRSVSQPRVNDAGTAAVLSVVGDRAPSDPRTAGLVTTLRDTTIPGATAGQGMRADVGGATAGYVDLADRITDALPLVIAVVLALSFVVLCLAFRSLLVPLKAVLMNVLSMAAAFGVVTYAFGHDWSATAVGLDGTVPIVSFVPLMMFAILFGLSMDYEVFLMSHVQERWKATGDAHRAVVEGVAGTARVITSAALIMVCVFCAFVLNGDPNIKQFGLGMAVAVAVDATVVRCLLVPAVMSLLDRAAWWLPRWLSCRMPHLSIEGEEHFARRDATA